MTRATAIWVFVFTLRAVVQGALYAANHPGWLAVVNIAMGVLFLPDKNGKLDHPGGVYLLQKNPESCGAMNIRSKRNCLPQFSKEGKGVGRIKAAIVCVAGDGERKQLKDAGCSHAAPWRRF